MQHYSNGRPKYDPAIHTRHKLPFELEEKVYLAKYYEVDGEQLMAAALERPEYTIARTIKTMRKNGEWELYKNLSDEEYEKIVITKERRETKCIVECQDAQG